MGRFFDEAARVLASSMPRRKALRLLGGAAAAGLVAAFGARPASAQAPVCTPACRSGKICCAGGGSGRGGWQPFCITDKKTCCGSKSCNQNQKCVNGRCEASIS